MTAPGNRPEDWPAIAITPALIEAAFELGRWLAPAARTQGWEDGRRARGHGDGLELLARFAVWRELVQAGAPTTLELTGNAGDAFDLRVVLEATGVPVVLNVKASRYPPGPKLHLYVKPAERLASQLFVQAFVELEAGRLTLAGGMSRRSVGGFPIGEIPTSGGVEAYCVPCADLVPWAELRRWLAAGRCPRDCEAAA